MRKLYLFAAMAAMLASCSSDDLTVEKQVAQQNADGGAVLFDVYTQRTTTRAGETGSITSADLRSNSTDLGKAGFGVFGYYTNSSTYDQQAIPNFFYNQKVYWNGAAFEYTPIKYWPNEFGSTANSEDADKVTYFAYAPWVSVNPSTGKPNGSSDPDVLSDLQKWGINSMTTNSTTGDPQIKYIASFDQAKSVDLCWGVCDETSWQKIQDGKSQTFALGMPWENVERPANTNQRLKFTFKHATAQLKVNIDAFVDGINNVNSVAAGTKVYVRAISFEGLAAKGSLNLNNREAGANKAYWMDYNGVNDLPMGETVTIYDGRKDGKEGTPSGEATNEKALGLNPNLVQSTLWTPATGDPAPMPGVTNVSQPLFCNGAAPATEPIYVIPTGDPVKVTITYDIETADDQLSTYVSDATQHGSSIENVIWKNITFGKDAEGKDINTFENGKSYTINLHLGMNSVKFDATVTDWVAQAANDVDLPANIPSYEAKKPAGDPISAEIAYDLLNYQFAITGLKPFETVKATDVATPVESADDVTANASGVAIVTMTFNKNNTVTNKATAAPVVFTGQESGNIVKINVTQKAAPLIMSVSALSADGKTFNLSSDAEAAGTNWSALTPAPTLTILKNGVPVSGSPTYKTAGTVICGVAFAEAAEAGDVYTFTLKDAGNAPVAEATAKVGGIKFGVASKDITYNPTAQASILPILYGPGETSADKYDWTPSSTGTAYFAAPGMITTTAAGDGIPVTAALNSTYLSSVEKGWFFTTASKSASYTLNVKKQAVKVVFTAPTIGEASYNKEATIGSAVSGAFTFKGADDNTTVDDGAVSYTITQVTKDGAIVDPATIELDGSNTLKVKSTTDPLPAGNYVVTVKASKATGTKYDAAVEEGNISFKANTYEP